MELNAASGAKLHEVRMTSNGMERYGYLIIRRTSVQPEQVLIGGRRASSLVKPKSVQDRSAAFTHQDLAMRMHQQGIITVILEQNEMFCFEGNCFAITAGELYPHGQLQSAANVRLQASGNNYLFCRTPS
jgi:hypothetical protein